MEKRSPIWMPVAALVIGTSLAWWGISASLPVLALEVTGAGREMREFMPAAFLPQWNPWYGIVGVMGIGCFAVGAWDLLERQKSRLALASTSDESVRPRGPSRPFQVCRRSQHRSCVQLDRQRGH